MSAPPDPGERAPVLVLALGNPLLMDDGVGAEILQLLASDLAHDARVELLDGGTQGIVLAERFAGRRGVLLLDAEQRGAAPGTLRLSSGSRSLQRAAPGRTAHEGNACALLAVVRLLEIPCGPVLVLGVEPKEVRTGYGLSSPVAGALPAAVRLARRAVEHLGGLTATKEASCTS